MMPDQKHLQLLPHGPSFRFIHELTQLDPGKSATATYTISGDEPCLEGHFPGNPIWPGVIMLEAIAQLGGIIAQSDPEIPELADMRLTSIKNAKILGTATPGQTLTITATLEGRLGPLIQIKGQVTANQTPIATAITMLSGTET